MQKAGNGSSVSGFENSSPFKHYLKLPVKGARKVFVVCEHQKTIVKV